MDRLQDALAEGSLDSDVFNARIEAALTSVTGDELRLLTSDLPRPSEPQLVPVKAGAPMSPVKLGAAATAYLLFIVGVGLLLAFGTIGGGWGNHPHGASEAEAVLGFIGGLIWLTATLHTWCEMAHDPKRLHEGEDRAGEVKRVA